jgi:nucleolar protein 56
MKSTPPKSRERIYLVTTVIGVFAVSEDNKIMDYIPFERDTQRIAEKLKAAEYQVIDEERRLMAKLKPAEFIFPVKKGEARHWDRAKEEFVKQNLRNLAVEKGFVKDQSEFNRLLTQVNITLTKVEIKKAVGRDSLVIQLNGAVEELDKSINILIERLREFYGLHFPEMDRMVENHERYALLVANFGQRDKIEDPELKRLAERSMGVDMRAEDIKAIQEFASKILELYGLRKDLNNYLDDLLKEVAPNFRALAGTTIAAKLIARAGGLDKLARIPSSTLQLIGAEKALFRHLHGHGKSPKHGIISSHPILQNASMENKGKLARVLASKLSIAAKMDKYSRKDESVKLKKELDEKIKEIIKSK